MKSKAWRTQILAERDIRVTAKDNMCPVSVCFSRNRADIPADYFLQEK